MSLIWTLQPTHGSLFLGQRFIYINTYALSFQNILASETSPLPPAPNTIPSSHQNLLGVQKKDSYVLMWARQQGKGHPEANNHLCVLETPKEEFYLK